MNKKTELRDQAEQLRILMEGSKTSSNSKIEKDLSQNNFDTPLPSRKDKHPKPKTFMEKPGFSLILFILFILILGSIFIYYTYFHQSKTSSNTSKANTNNKTTVIDITNEDNIIERESAETTSNSSNEPLMDNAPSETSNQDLSSTDPENNINENEIDKKNEEEQNNEQIYVVKENDTLFSISNHFYNSKVGIEIIKKANQLKDNQIYIGMKLVIPKVDSNP